MEIRNIPCNILNSAKVLTGKDKLRPHFDYIYIDPVNQYICSCDAYTLYYAWDLELEGNGKAIIKFKDKLSKKSLHCDLVDDRLICNTQQQIVEHMQMNGEEITEETYLFHLKNQVLLREGNQIRPFVAEYCFSSSVLANAEKCWGKDCFVSLVSENRINALDNKIAMIKQDSKELLVIMRSNIKTFLPDESYQKSLDAQWFGY